MAHGVIRWIPACAGMTVFFGNDGFSWKWRCFSGVTLFFVCRSDLDFNDFDFISGEVVVFIDQLADIFRVLLNE